MKKLIIENKILIKTEKELNFLIKLILFKKKNKIYILILVIDNYFSLL